LQKDWSNIHKKWNLFRRISSACRITQDLLATHTHTQNSWKSNDGSFKFVNHYNITPQKKGTGQLLNFELVPRFEIVLQGMTEILSETG
jgi:hypothetical protein